MAEERLPHGLQRLDATTLSAAEARKLYERDQLLWIRLPPRHRETCAAFSHQTIAAQFQKDAAFFAEHFSVENACKHGPKDLTPATVFGKDGNGSTFIRRDTGPFYVSTILQRSKTSLDRFFSSVPFDKAPFLKSSYHDDGVWFFFGFNPRQLVEAESASKGKVHGKRKRQEHTVFTTQPIGGRPEHVDNVRHDGTWHLQLSGTKTWFVRPLKSAKEWSDIAGPPKLKGKTGAWQGGLAGVRLKICVEEGDMLVINTRAWWHRTEIEPQCVEEVLPKKRRAEKGKTKLATPELSVSYARDFYLNGKPSAGEGSDEEDAGMVFSEQNHDNDGAAEGVAKTNDTLLDPRLIATTMVYCGEVAVAEEDLPEMLPRSRDPNCDLCVCEIDGEEQVAMLAARDIYIGEVFSIKIDEDEDEDDMEQWELDTTTGEMTRVNT